MTEMIEIFHEKLLFYPPDSFETKNSDNQGTYLKEELSSKNNLTGTQTEESIKRDSSIMELPVNNFLKSLKEIEAEFYYVLNSIKTAINEIPGKFDSFERLMRNAETNINSAGMELSGYMEENY